MVEKFRTRKLDVGAERHEPDQHRRSAAANRLHRQRRGFGFADALDGDVSAAGGEFEYFGRRIRVVCINDIRCAHRLCNPQLGVEKVHGKDARGPGNAGALNRRQADRSATDYHDCVTGPDAGRIQRRAEPCGNATAQHGGLGKGELSGNRDQRVFVGQHPLGKRPEPRHGENAVSVPDHTLCIVGGAKRCFAGTKKCLAPMAIGAQSAEWIGDPDNTVARLQAPDALAHRFDHTRRFMTDHGGHGLWKPALRNGQVRVADACLFHSHLHFARPDVPQGEIGDLQRLSGIDQYCTLHLVAAPCRYPCSFLMSTPAATRSHSFVLGRLRSCAFCTRSVGVFGSSPTTSR